MILRSSSGPATVTAATAALLTLAAACIGAPAAPAALRVDPIRVLPLGDSITQGGRKDREEYTYRYPLFYRLREAGYSVDFIGSLRTGLHGDAT